MALAPARNAWLGNGLTHHLGEPRVHSFTSPIGEMIPLIGESVHQGLFLLKFTALIASAMAIYYAYRIGSILKFHWAAQILLLSYLATDQLQIFFGMSGMETQIAATIFLATLYYLLEERWELLGLTAGLGMLVRPEFVFCIAAIGLFMLAKHPRKLPTVIGIFLCVITPWYLFAYFYYGSVIPNTILAKSVAGRFGPFKSSPSEVWIYFKNSWENIAPFKEWYFEEEAPVPVFIIQAAVLMVLAMTIFGIVCAFLKKEWRLVTIAGIVILFFLYRSLSRLSVYFMWYLPPFMALLLVIAAYGLSEIGWKNSKAAVSISVFLAIMYAMHIPFSFAGEREIQEKLECDVRYKTGAILNSMMGASDTAVLEPLGYVGYAAFNKTIYDYPGLSSRHVVQAYSHMKGFSLVDLIDELQPSFVALRQPEVKWLQDQHPDTAANYAQVADIKLADGVTFKKWGYSSAKEFYDQEYLIMQRVAPPTELGKQISPFRLEATDVYGICKNIPSTIF